MKTYTEGSLRQELLMYHVEAFLAAIVANSLFQRPAKERTISVCDNRGFSNSVDVRVVADPNDLYVVEEKLRPIDRRLVTFHQMGADGLVTVCARKMTAEETQHIVSILASQWNVLI